MNNLNFDNNLLELYSELEYDSIESLNAEIIKYSNIFLHVNVRSLNANFTKIEAYINSLAVKPLIIVCSESWKIVNPNIYNIESYTIYYNEGSINNADGTVLYIQSNVQHKVEIVEYECQGQNEILKFKILNCEVKVNENCLIGISCIYRCHNLSKTALIDCLKTLMEKNKYVNHFVVGDFNIDILSLENESELMLNNCYSAGYIPLFKSVTRPNINGGSCIDNMFVKSNLELIAIKHSQILPDHYPLICAFNIENLCNNDTSTYNKINYRKLNEIAYRVNWNKYLCFNDPDELINCLIKDINLCSNAATYKTKKSKSNLRKSWMTNEI